MRPNKRILSACVDKSIYARIQMVATAMGISTSEYIRRLIINDLEKRSVFDSLYKRPLPDREEEAQSGGG
jgi:antitoxin component of RelBE/YafQ-DinJ toxin-antitoxin module